eukprot:TRINITY_DN61_c0_g1_i5.p1 TRINITY_DN61_c0_g1~~TRINITY_DN61_c0_g1_i5.p1  ORF type:complete len:1565 (+),score=563.19 TRINITY_DN61_c0_g1_i5:115-4695(+)
MEGDREMDTFLEYFSANHRDDNFSTIKYGNYEIKKQDLEGEILDWTLQYLQYMSCPASLEAGLAKAVLDETKLSYLNEDQPDCGKAVPGKQAFTSLALLQNVTVTVSEVCKRLKKEESYRRSFLRSKNLYPCSSCAIRNGRKKMEDRHIIIHDLNAIFKYSNDSSSNHDVKNGDDSDDRASFYGVFDGHVGKDAAAFTAAHLHQYLLQSEHYPSDPVKATYDAMHKTNTGYEKKSEKEDKALKCGSTVVFTLILGRKMYISWLGDSQVLLVRNGCPIRVMTPHKPDRKDERERISDAGGTVLHYGQWRVNGLLAVSRSIGDFEHRAFISAEPDVTSVDMNGSEDFVILASDGLWDYMAYDKATSAVYRHLVEHAGNNGDIDKLSSELANLSKKAGSGDNISIVVVFIKPPAQLISEELARSEIGHEKQEEDFTGITSTCAYVRRHIMGDTEGGPTGLLSAKEIGGAFSSPGGGGMNFGGFSPAHEEHSEEHFRRASDSMFKEENDILDNAWNGASNGRSINNPFLPHEGVSLKPDSGFISPACNSSNKSSDEDRKEDEEFLESQEVSKLLGGRPMEELLSRDTPTPPPETGTSLEEILAVARDNPDSVGEVDDDDSDDSSTEDPKQQQQQLLSLRGGEQQDATTPTSGAHAGAQSEDSEEEENDEDFTFVKKEESTSTELKAAPLVSNGHHAEEAGPSSVIIETQEAPNPDSASFILKTSSSEAPELPSPQEPVVEMIMEPESNMGNSSPILEEVEEDMSRLASPAKNKPAAAPKESSQLECEETNSHPTSPKKPQNKAQPAVEEVEEVVEEMIESMQVANIGANTLPPLVTEENEKDDDPMGQKDEKSDGKDVDQSLDDDLLPPKEKGGAPLLDLSDALNDGKQDDKPSSVGEKSSPKQSGDKLPYNEGPQTKDVKNEDQPLLLEDAISEVNPTDADDGHSLAQDVDGHNMNNIKGEDAKKQTEDAKDVMSGGDDVLLAHPATDEAANPKNPQEEKKENKKGPAVGDEEMPSEDEMTKDSPNEDNSSKAQISHANNVHPVKEDVKTAKEEHPTEDEAMNEDPIQEEINEQRPNKEEITGEHLKENAVPKTSPSQDEIPKERLSQNAEKGSVQDEEESKAVPSPNEEVNKKTTPQEEPVNQEPSEEAPLSETQEIVKEEEVLMESKVEATTAQAAAPLDKESPSSSTEKEEAQPKDLTKEDDKVVKEAVSSPMKEEDEEVKADKSVAEVVSSSSSSLPSSKGGSPKKEIKPPGKKPLTSTTSKSASSSPKKATPAATAGKTSSMTSRRPASATKPALSKATTPKAGAAPPKPSSASRLSMNKNPAVKPAPSRPLSSSASSTKATTANSTLTKKPLGAARTATSATARSSAASQVKSKVESSSSLNKPLRAPLAGSITKPRVPSARSTTAAKSNGSSSNPAPLRKTTPLSSRTPAAKRPSESHVKPLSTTRPTAASSRLASKTTTTVSKTTVAAPPSLRKPATAKVSTGLTRPKSAKAAPKPAENGKVNGKEAPVLKSEGAEEVSAP